MRPCVETPLSIRGRQIGGIKPLFCVPLVATNIPQLVAQARGALAAGPDFVEWRADSFLDLTTGGMVDAAGSLGEILGEIPVIFTLRHYSEGGARELSQEARMGCFEAVLASRMFDLIDVELCNGPEFVSGILGRLHGSGVRSILSFHDFASTPSNEVLLGTIETMSRAGADLAKIAVMPANALDVLRLLEITVEARRKYPRLPLSMTSMGAVGSMSRVVGFLFGSDISYAAAHQISAPGQMALADARAVTQALLSYL